MMPEHVPLMADGSNRGRSACVDREQTVALERSGDRIESIEDGATSLARCRGGNQAGSDSERGPWLAGNDAPAPPLDAKHDRFAADFRSRAVHDVTGGRSEQDLAERVRDDAAPAPLDPLQDMRMMPEDDPGSEI